VFASSSRTCRTPFDKMLVDSTVERRYSHGLPRPRPSSEGSDQAMHNTFCNRQEATIGSSLLPHLTHTKIVYTMKVVYERIDCGNDSEHFIPGEPAGGY
jgi:hypothetical protein